MKGKYFLLFILLIASGNILGQNFNAGIRFGINGSQVNGDNLEGYDKLGIIAGAYVNRKFSDIFSMQMEIVYIQKGSRKPTDENNTFYRMRVNYIEVPLLASFHIAKSFDLYLGPSFGTLIFSEEDDQFGPYPDPIPFEKFELAGNAGLVYKLSDHWSFDGRFSNSLTTIRPFPGTSYTFFEAGQYNMLIEFTLLFKF